MNEDDQLEAEIDKAIECALLVEECWAIEVQVVGGANDGELRISIIYPDDNGEFQAFSISRQAAANLSRFLRQVTRTTPRLRR